MVVMAKDLDKPLKSFLEDGEVKGATDDEIKDAGGWHQGQEAFLSRGEDWAKIQKFLDFVPRRVFLPWLEALTQKSNKDGNVAKGCAIGLDFVPLVFEHLFPENVDDSESQCFAAAIALGQISTALGCSDEDALEKRYFLFDQKTQGLYYYNKREMLEIKVFKYPPTPIYSFSSNVYNYESATPMSGIAVAGAIKPVDDRVKALEETTVPALEKRMTGAEENIEAEQERTDFLLGDARGLIVSMALNPTEDEIFGEDAIDPNSMSMYVPSNLMKRNKWRGLENDDKTAGYYVLDVKEKALYYGTVLDYLERSEDFRPILSFAALNEYDAESSTAMSGIAVAEALATFENETLPKKIKDYVDLEILGGEW